VAHLADLLESLKIDRIPRSRHLLYVETHPEQSGNHLGHLACGYTGAGSKPVLVDRRSLALESSMTAAEELR